MKIKFTFCDNKTEDVEYFIDNKHVNCEICERLHAGDSPCYYMEGFNLITKEYCPFFIKKEKI